MKGPGLFSDIGKKAKNLLTKDYSYDQKLTISTRSANGVASRGKSALEACNCLIINFKASHDLHLKCSKLIDIATSCLHSKDYYLKSSVKFFEKHFQNL